jgi:hypothetical protein
MSTVDERTVAELRRYLSDAADRREWVASPKPLDRSVVVHAETWRPWLDGRKSLRTDWSAIAVSALDDLPMTGGGSALDERRVDRSTLMELSTELATEPTDERRVRLLVTTLLWGSGTSNGRAPRYAARTLLDERLAPTLTNTAALVASGHLAEAHDAFRVRGIGPSFFTKWFWVVGLATATEPRPLIRICQWPRLSGGSPVRSGTPPIEAQRSGTPTMSRASTSGLAHSHRITTLLGSTQRRSSTSCPTESLDASRTGLSVGDPVRSVDRRVTAVRYEQGRTVRESRQGRTT